MKDKRKDLVANDSTAFLDLIKELETPQTHFNPVKEAFRHNREELQNLFCSFPDAIIVTDLNGNIVECNDEALRLHGFSSKEELADESIYNLVSKKDQRTVSKSLDKIIQQNMSQPTEYNFVTKEGKEFLAELSESIIHNPMGKSVGFILVIKDASERKRKETELRQSFESLQTLIRGVIQVMASMIEVRDPYTSCHQIRVSNLACAIAKEMRILSAERIDGIRAAGIVHDIGKIYVPSELLSKPGTLNEMEFNIVKTHPKVGYDILKHIEFPWPVAQTVLQHHERLDGSGYPLGLSDKDIIIEAKILSVADVVEAISSHRPYRPALGMDIAISEILEHKGILYEPKVVDACHRLLTEKGFKFANDLPFGVQSNANLNSMLR